MKKPVTKMLPLTVTEIILRGEAAVIREALAAREKIDTLLAEREAAYQRIAELEAQVDEIVGDEAAFPFPPPPCPVAEFELPRPAAAKPRPKSRSAVPANPAVSTEAGGPAQLQPEAGASTAD